MAEPSINSYTFRRNQPLLPESGVSIGSAMDAAWGKLSDFDAWSGWVPAVTEADLVGKVAPGRGARVRVVFGTEEVEFSIAHWEPSRRLALVQKQESCRVAYVFDFGGDESQLSLKATVELQLSGLSRLFQFHYKAKHGRRCLSILDAMMMA